MQGDLQVSLAVGGPGHEPLPHDDAGVALLTAQHVSRVAGLLNAAPTAAPLLLPILTRTTCSSLNQAARRQVGLGP